MPKRLIAKSPIDTGPDPDDTYPTLGTIVRWRDAAVLGRFMALVQANTPILVVGGGRLVESIDPMTTPEGDNVARVVWSPPLAPVALPNGTVQAPGVPPPDGITLVEDD